MNTQMIVGPKTKEDADISKDNSVIKVCEKPPTICKQASGPPVLPHPIQ